MVVNVNIVMEKWIFLIGLVVMFSCDSVEDETSKAEDAQSVIAQNSFELEENVIEMVQSTGLEALLDLIDLWDVVDIESESGVFARNIDREEVEKELFQLTRAFTPRITCDDNTYSGIYEWSSLEQDFLLINEDVEYMEVRFPIEGSNVNNAVFSISEIVFLDFEEDDDVDDVYVTKITSEMIVDGVLVASLNLNFGYNDMQFFDDADVDLYLAPFDYKLEFTDSEEKQTSLSASVHRDEQKLMYADILVIYEDFDKYYEESVEGEINIHDLSLAGTIDIKGLDEEVFEGTPDLNEYFTLEVLHEGESIGEINVNSSEEEFEFVITYEDGTSESLSDLFEESITEIENILLELELD